MLTSIVSFIVVFFIVALTHELGHFIWAKRAGIRVLELGFGFGPKLFSIERNGTAYSLSLVPILAFVRLAGIDNDSEEDKKTPLSEQYYSKSPWQKFKSIAAGPLLNLCLGFVIFSFVAGFSGLPELSTEVGSVMDNSPAKKAGLLPKDVIVSFQGVPIKDPVAMIYEIHKNAGKKIDLEVLRKGKQVKISAIAKYDKKLRAGIIGFTLASKITKYSPLQAVWAGAQKSSQIIISILVVLGGLFIGKISIFDLAGPIGIAQLSGQVATQGFSQFLIFTAFISLNLGVLNLLPIPALDGGRLVFIVIEAIRKRPVNIETENRIHQWGLIGLLVFMFIISINDLIRILLPKFIK